MRLHINDLDQFVFEPVVKEQAEEAMPVMAAPLPVQATKKAKTRARRSKDEFSVGQRQRMFAYWCGNEDEGPCPVCERQTLVRTERRSWELAHVCAWSKGGPCALWNLFPCCSVCNKAAELGGRRRGRQGVNHFEGMVLDGFSDPARYGWTLGQFMDRAYGWLIASGARDRDRDVQAGEDRADIVEAWYGPAVPGGFSRESRVLDTYREWLQTQQTLQELDEEVAAAKRLLAEAQTKARETQQKRRAFIEYRGHYCKDANAQRQ